MLLFCVSGWYVVFFFFKQKTAYEMRISDWSSDVCSSDLLVERDPLGPARRQGERFVVGAEARGAEASEEAHHGQVELAVATMGRRVDEPAAAGPDRKSVV